MSPRAQKSHPVVYYAESAVSRLSPLWAAVTLRKSSAATGVSGVPSTPTKLHPSSEICVWAAAYGMEEPDFLAEAGRRGPAKFVYDPERVATVLKQMEEFLRGERHRFEVKVDWSGMTPFQIAVRKAVMAVPYGKTASYGDIAAAVGKPQAPRAVGGVQATNPISFIIPCHRIIGADGNLHGYGGFGGLKTKAWLLELEAGHS